MLHFTIREVLLLTLVAAIAVAWWVDHSRLVYRRTAGMGTPESSKPRKRRWSWRQYSLSTLLGAVAIVSVVLGLVTHRAERQRRAVAAIRELGGSVRYDFELMTPNDPPGPDWLGRILGEG